MTSFLLIEGDIAEAGEQAIVNAWNRNFIPHWLLIPQGVSKALRKKAGNRPFQEVGRHGLLALGQAVVTSAGELPAQYIIHAAALHAYWRASEKSVRLAARNSFRCAHDLGVDSLAIPLLGAGTGGVSPEQSFEIIREEWNACDKVGVTTVYVFETQIYKALAGRALV